MLSRRSLLKGIAALLPVSALKPTVDLANLTWPKPSGTITSMVFMTDEMLKDRVIDIQAIVAEHYTKEFNKYIERELGS